MPRVHTFVTQTKAGPIKFGPFEPITLATFRDVRKFVAEFKRAS